jgi:hypothetical protein
VEEGKVAIALASTQHHCHVVEGQAMRARGCFHGHYCQQPLHEKPNLEIVSAHTIKLYVHL